MKRFVCIVIAGLLFVSAIGQNNICLSTDKTTSLVFPFPIKHVDRGTAAVLAKKVDDIPTILLVKAGTKNFTETNLSVATEDGSLYTFTVSYDASPKVWSYQLPVQRKETITTYASGIMDNPPIFKRIKDSKLEMQLEVTGIYIKEDVMYFQLLMSNNTPIDYSVDVLRFFITDKKRSKRTAVQENELKPFHVLGNSQIIKANARVTSVFAMPKFTIPDAKYLGIQIMEQNGGRNLLLKLQNKHLLKAQPLN